MATRLFQDGGRSGSASRIIVGLMLLLLPIVAIQGPAHTTAFDVFNVIFIVAYWARMLLRRDSIGFPLALPIWVILMGSIIGMYNAGEFGRSLLFLGKEVYLYAWFVTAVHFISRNCRVSSVVAIWVGIAVIMSLLMLIDQQLGFFGGLFGGEVRGSGTFENPNMCGSYITMSVFIAWSAAAGGRRHYYIAVPILILGILATASNGALASLLVGTIAATALHPLRRPLQWVGAALVGAALVIVVVATTSDTLVKSGMDMMSRGRDSVGGTAVAGAMERFPLWLDAADSVRRVPTGVGPGNFNRNGGSISGVFHGAHNEYLGQLAERGPIGFFGWCAILISAAAALIRLQRSGSATFLGIGIEPLIGAVAAVALHACVMEFFHFRHLWMLLVVVYAAVAERGVISARQPVAVRQPAVMEGA
jgi:hypothetical protein